MDLKNVAPKPAKWILDMTWLNLVELSNIKQFSGLLEQVSLFYASCVLLTNGTQVLSTHTALMDSNSKTEISL